MATIKCGLARPLWLQHKNQIGQCAKLFGRNPVQHYNNTNVAKALTSEFYCSTTCLVWCIDCHSWQFFQSHNLDLYSEWTKKICSKRIKKSTFKFVKTSSNLVNSSDLNQDLVGDFQGIFTYQPSIFAAKFIVYSTIHLWFQSIAM